jgi:S1-C subfamily serine protease
LRDGDMIIGWNDQPVADVDALHRALADHHSGIRASVTVLRGTEKLTLKIEPSVR